MKLRLSLAALFGAWLIASAVPALAAGATTPARPAPVRRPVARRPAARWTPPVVIPANYLVRPALADLPDLAPPLVNLTLRELTDSFAYRRWDGAMHWGIDIFRPPGDPLLAVVDGRVHLIDNPLGGLSVYLTDATNAFRFYYAHLDAYPAGLRDGAMVRQGDLIGYVGNTGNARYTKPHLHFEIHLLAPWMLDEIGQVSVKAGMLNPCAILRQLVEQQAALALAADRSGAVPASGHK